MNKKFTVSCVLIDTENENKENRLFVKVDTVANRAVLYEIAEDDERDLKAIFDTEPDYHLIVRSDLLVQLVDQLGGIVIDKERIDGKKALKLFRESRLDDIIEATGKALDGKNLLKTIPSLLSLLKENYETDMPVMDIIRMVLGEVNDLRYWKAELIKADKEKTYR